MAVVHNPEGTYAREMNAWNTAKRFGGHGANGFEEYPRMLYRAQIRANGKASCMADAPSSYGWRDAAEYDRACLEAEAFTRSCQLIVQSADEQDRAAANGWCVSPQAAMAAHEAALVALGRAAAEEAYRVARMGEQARAEFDAADRATHEHIADVAPPKRRPGRPKTSHHKKVAPVAVAG